MISSVNYVRVNGVLCALHKKQISSFNQARAISVAVSLPSNVPTRSLRPGTYERDGVHGLLLRQIMKYRLGHVCVY